MPQNFDISDTAFETQDDDEQINEQTAKLGMCNVSSFS
jgi:hypothetical protein